METILNSPWLNGELQNSIKKISTANPACVKWCGRKKNQKLDDPAGLQKKF